MGLVVLHGNRIISRLGRLKVAHGRNQQRAAASPCPIFPLFGGQAAGRAAGRWGRATRRTGGRSSRPPPTPRFRPRTASAAHFHNHVNMKDRHHGPPRKIEPQTALPRPKASKAVAVVREGNPVRPAHPVRSKNDCGRQVSWLTGRCAPAAFSGEKLPQWLRGRSTHRLQLQGQRGHCTRLPF